MHLTLFFTYGVSLKNWAESGLLKREVLLYQELMRCYDLQVQFITYGDSSDRQWEGELKGIKLLPVFERIRHTNSKIIRMLKTLYIPWAFREELSHTDLLKTNQIWGSWVAVISKWFFHKPLFLRCGYDAYKNNLEEGKGGIRKHVLRWSSWLAYRSADQVWLSTSEISEFVQLTFGVISARITVMQNWIDTSKFAPNYETERFEKHILFVGRLSSEKNLPLLFKALQGNDFTLDVIGSGDLKKELWCLAVKYGVQIQFHSIIPNDQMPEVYNRYKVYVLCSRFEGNPKTLLEAMACGNAVIGTDVPGVREIIKHEISCLLVPVEHKSLRLAIQRLMSDENLCRFLGEHARKQIMENNSLEKALNVEYAAYDSLLNK